MGVRGPKRGDGPASSRIPNRTVREDRRRAFAGPSASCRSPSVASWTAGMVRPSRAGPRSPRRTTAGCVHGRRRMRTCLRRLPRPLRTGGGGGAEGMHPARPHARRLQDDELAHPAGAPYRNAGFGRPACGGSMPSCAGPRASPSPCARAAADAPGRGDVRMTGTAARGVEPARRGRERVPPVPESEQAPCPCLGAVAPGREPRGLQAPRPPPMVEAPARRQRNSAVRVADGIAGGLPAERRMTRGAQGGVIRYAKDGGSAMPGASRVSGRTGSSGDGRHRGSRASSGRGCGRLRHPAPSASTGESGILHERARKLESGVGSLSSSRSKARPAGRTSSPVWRPGSSPFAQAGRAKPVSGVLNVSPGTTGCDLADAVHEAPGIRIPIPLCATAGTRRDEGP